jgi:hypothetical protein
MSRSDNTIKYAVAIDNNQLMNSIDSHHFDNLRG